MDDTMNGQRHPYATGGLPVGGFVSRGALVGAFLGLTMSVGLVAAAVVGLLAY
jgi:hypothetical protein